MEASAKFDFIDFTDAPRDTISVVWVDVENFHVNQVVLRQGNILRVRVTASSYATGGYTYYTPGNYRFDYKK